MEEKLRAIIVEDEAEAAGNLVAALKRTSPGVTVQKVCKNAKEAKEAIEDNKPDLLFLDIYLNGKPRAFEILNMFPESNFKIIFTTAYEKYALMAFEYNAVHYLLKPYSDEKLAEAVKRAKHISPGEQKENLNGYKLTDDFIRQRSDSFAFRTNDGNYVVRNYNDIKYLEADGYYIKACFADGSEESNTKKPLSEYEEILKCRGFLRISSKHLVNTKFIDKFKPASKNCTTANPLLPTKTEGAGGSVLLKNNGGSLPVSRQCCREVKDALGIG